MHDLADQPPVQAPPTRRLFTYDPGEHVLGLDIDNTSLEHFATCARSAQYRLVESREPSGTRMPLEYGSAKHLYLEHRLRGHAVPEAEQILVNYLGQFQSDDPKEWRTVTHAVDSMRGYEQYWASMPIEPVQKGGQPLVEVPFRLPLCDVAIPPLPWSRIAPHLTNPLALPPSRVPRTVRVYWTGKIDVVAPFLGDNYVWDHKTTSQAGPTFYSDFVLSAQTHGYVFAANHLWPELNIRGLRVNIIVGRAVTPTGTPHSYERQTYVYNREHIAEWHKDTQILVSDFIAHFLRDYFPKQTRWCQGRFGTCPYFSICSAMPSQRHIVLNSSQYSDVTWSPLLPSQLTKPAPTQLVF